MRKREEIIKEFDEENQIFTQNDIFLEVLLDIRELLQNSITVKD